MMTPEQQRIKIAELCGWRVTDPEHSMGIFDGDPPKAGLIPDYLNDLNASYDMEEHLTIEEWFRYTEYVDLLSSGAWQFRMFRATASQKARAFLQTKGQWT